MSEIPNYFVVSKLKIGGALLISVKEIGMIRRAHNLKRLFSF